MHDYNQHKINMRWKPKTCTNNEKFWSDTWHQRLVMHLMIHSANLTQFTKLVILLFSFRCVSVYAVFDRVKDIVNVFHECNFRCFCSRNALVEIQNSKTKHVKKKDFQRHALLMRESSSNLWIKKIKKWLKWLWQFYFRVFLLVHRQHRNWLAIMFVIDKKSKLTTISLPSFN